MYLLGHERQNRERREREGHREIFTRLHAGFDHRFETIRNAYANLLQVCLDHSAVFATGFLVFCGASLLVYTHLGQDFFPSVDAGDRPG
jgi:multidrug efflux pump subunit AcrB